jgi:type III secretion system YscQ/HrcQ family protein
LRTIDGPDSWDVHSPLGRPSVDAGALGVLPSLVRRQVRLEERLGLNGSKLGPGGLLAGVADLLGEELDAERFEVHWRGAGLGRPGVIAQLTWPRLSTRVGLGIEPPLAHALVDRLLGFDRLPAEGRLQVTPVEWGILSFLMARALERLEESPGPFGPWDLALDRVGPDPFDPTGLGPIVTWRWRIRLGQAVASARLWLPESLLAPWLIDESPSPGSPISLARYADLSSEWRAEAGSIAMARGLSRLRPGVLLLIEGSPMTGTPSSPEGPIDLAQDERAHQSTLRARALPGSHAARLIVESYPRRVPRPREALAMPAPVDSIASQGQPHPGPLATADVPVTLIVELGRINLPLHRLADLKPGDVLELGRHPREPVELTSGGRLVARGELVQVDTELGVRVTQVFL